MRLKIFMLCLVALFVSQTKNIVHTSSTASTMIQNFQETVKIYKQGKEYYDGAPV